MKAWGTVPKVTDIDRADIGVISKACQMQSGRHVVTHTRNGANYDITVKIEGQQIQVTFPLPDGKQRRLKATWKPEEVHFGTRPTFLCPSCGEDCKQLYPTPGGCRACCGIRYRQKGKRWPKPETMETTGQIVRLLDWIIDGTKVIKPKDMTEARFQRFIDRYNELVDANKKALKEAAPILTEQQRKREYWAREAREEASARGYG